MIKYFYGCLQDKPDPRDLAYGLFKTLPTPALSLDLSSGMPEIWDQGQIGSCTAHSTLAVYGWRVKNEGLRYVDMSRLFQYYDSRKLEGTIGTDSGATIRDSIKSLVTYGACPEAMWPYDTTKFSVTPTADLYTNAKQHLVLKYESVAQVELLIKQALTADGPIAFGISVYESFESSEAGKTGLIPMPKDGEQRIGGHAIALVGYDDSTKLFKCRNSWGVDWGDKGYFYLPYEYLLDERLAQDFWVITEVEKYK